MHEYFGTIYNVVDGDTVDVNLDLGFKTFSKQRLRLNKIDCPEMKSKDAEERVKAKRAKDFTSSALLDKTFIIKTTKTDGFGRYLADIIMDDGSNFSDILLENGLAVLYQK